MRGGSKVVAESEFGMQQGVGYPPGKDGNCGAHRTISQERQERVCPDSKLIMAVPAGEFPQLPGITEGPLRIIPKVGSTRQFQIPAPEPAVPRIPAEAPEDPRSGCIHVPGG